MRKKVHAFRSYFVLFFVILLLGIAILLADKLVEIVQNPSLLKDLAQERLLYAVLFMMALHISGVLVAPLPEKIIILTNGFIFGTTVGFGVSIVASVVGTTTAFWLSRQYGRKLVKYLVDPRDLNHFRIFLSRKGKVGLALTYLIPIFPNDSIAYILGLTKMPFRTFLLINTLGFIPNILLLTWFGDLFFTYKLSGVAYLMVILLLVIGSIIILRHWVRTVLFKELRFVEKKLEHEIEFIDKELKEVKNIV